TQAASRRMAAGSSGPARSTACSARTCSRRAVSSSRSRFCSSAQYRKPLVTSTSAKAEPAYQAVSRAASDQGRPAGGSEAVFEDIAGPADGVDQLALERGVHLGPQPADVDVHDV